LTLLAGHIRANAPTHEEAVELQRKLDIPGEPPTVEGVTQEFRERLGETIGRSA
jgi:hypothetical protein